VQTLAMGIIPHRKFLNYTDLTIFSTESGNTPEGSAFAFPLRSKTRGEEQ